MLRFLSLGVAALSLVILTGIWSGEASVVKGGGCTGASQQGDCPVCAIQYSPEYTGTVPEGVLPSATSGTSQTVCSGQTDSTGQACGATTMTPAVSGC